jgi:hypothetical protein
MPMIGRHRLLPRNNKSILAVNPTWVKKQAATVWWPSFFMAEALILVHLPQTTHARSRACPKAYARAVPLVETREYTPGDILLRRSCSRHHGDTNPAGSHSVPKGRHPPGLAVPKPLYPAQYHAHTNVLQLASPAYLQFSLQLPSLNKKLPSSPAGKMRSIIKQPALNVKHPTKAGCFSYFTLRASAQYRSK